MSSLKKMPYTKTKLSNTTRSTGTPLKPDPGAKKKEEDLLFAERWSTKIHRHQNPMGRVKGGNPEDSNELVGSGGQGKGRWTTSCSRSDEKLGGE